ncbi:hypothetical protein G647_08674 [Cladophialophora carrionii CBS 160.54]|uniref:Apple domain-containing protein n=1 Tax=Cladophialophora carrionii CBS 160.54 TaxID=1279043 RepID=V9D105_9EURO|nr:uncharacterized protein G647_08674 [Cladophialophora carrionii CBS 160.54]ETI19662.1 hypothetical protein G647_08674 [Cladophialophora carrionii CBS 160.54]
MRVQTFSVVLSAITGTALAGWPGSDRGCDSGIYAKYQPLTNYEPAERYCSAHFPQPVVTVTVTATARGWFPWDKRAWGPLNPRDMLLQQLEQLPRNQQQIVCSCIDVPKTTTVTVGKPMTRRPNRPHATSSGPVTTTSGSTSFTLRTSTSSSYPSSTTLSKTTTLPSTSSTSSSSPATTSTTTTTKTATTTTPVTTTTTTTLETTTTTTTTSSLSTTTTTTTTSPSTSTTSPPTTTTTTTITPTTTTTTTTTTSATACPTDQATAPGGGCGGCTWTISCGQLVTATNNNPNWDIDPQPDYASCLRECDDNGFCAAFTYNAATGQCRQFLYGGDGDITLTPAPAWDSARFVEGSCTGFDCVAYQCPGENENCVD